MSLDLQDALRFELHYSRLLPTSVISRFIVHMQAHPAEATLWRQGICAKMDGHDYLVTLHDRERKIKVAIFGKGESRIGVLEKIRHGLTLANRAKKGLLPVEWVPLADDPEAGIEYTGNRTLCSSVTTQVSACCYGTGGLRVFCLLHF